MILSLLVVLIGINGCGTFKKKEPIVITNTEYVYPEIKSPPDPINLLPARFTVVTEETVQDYLDENRLKYGALVFIGLDVRDYENLALNMAELERYIKAQKAIIHYYEDAATPKEAPK